MLISAVGLTALRRRQDPVRMCPVEIRILVGHLRLEPESKPHPHCLDPLRQPGDAVGQPVPVGLPVSQTGPVAASCAKPPVVQNKKLHAAFFRL